MMTAWRFFSAWLALAVSSQSLLTCTDALSVQHHLGRHQADGSRCSTAASLFGNNNGRLTNCRLSMMSNNASASAQTSAWTKLTVPQLKAQLKELNLPVSGVKAELIQRLEDHQTSLSATTAESSTNNEDDQSKNRKRSISFPPPKDETEIKVMEKEVHETVQLLDSLKLGNGNNGNGQQQPSSSATEAPPRQLSRQKKQEKELMQSLKQSMKQSQQSQKNTNPEKNNEQQAPPSYTQPAPPSEHQAAHAEQVQHYTEQLRVQPANVLKAELNSLRMSSKGRKPDLVQRLAEHYVSKDASDGHDDGGSDIGVGIDIGVEIPILTKPSPLNLDRPMSFAGIPRLSTNAANALHQAFGGETTSSSSDPKPTPIQSEAIPKLFSPSQPSALLHAPTGSGKTIAYLLPITETLWKEVESAEKDNTDVNDMNNGMALILLPTRELAAQVAGVAAVLAPNGMVGLVARPMDLMNVWNFEVTDRGEEFEYLEKEGVDEQNESKGKRYRPRILVGSAKSISTSLFGDKKMPGTPTNKPQGKQLLSSVRWLVMDEVDRLLDIKKTRTDKRSRHEKPAAMLAAAIARLTVGRVQVIAASATVGRPLRRELSRVLGLHSSECPETLRGEEDTAQMHQRVSSDDITHVGRAVRIPDTVRNYVLPVDGSTTGSLLTSAAFASKAILQPIPNSEAVSNRRVLLVITRNCGIKVHDALGALRHFGIRPEPQSLLDALEADGTDRLVEAHRKVSGVEGVGGKKNKLDDSSEDEGYLLVTHEDNVRGLHLDGLDVVIVVGRPGSPDEYTHIAGRTGRAGRRGSVLNIVSFEQAAALASWTKMLGVDFLPVDESDIASVVDDN